MSFHANKPHCTPCNFPVATNWSKPFPVPPDSTKQTGLCPFPPSSSLLDQSSEPPPLRSSVRHLRLFEEAKTGKGMPLQHWGIEIRTTIRHRIESFDLPMFLLMVESIKILNLVKKERMCSLYGLWIGVCIMIPPPPPKKGAPCVVATIIWTRCLRAHVCSTPN